jgi:hypothetical protein
MQSKLWQVKAVGLSFVLSVLSGRAVLSQTASFSGSVFYLAPSGAITSIAAEVVLPPGLYFNGNPTVTYSSSGTPGTVTFRPTSLTLEPGPILANHTLSPSAQVAFNLSQIANLTTNEANLATYISIVRAAGGADGLD